MPKGLPTPAQAWEEVTFSSLDTNLIQAAGYNFAQGVSCPPFFVFQGSMVSIET